MSDQPATKAEAQNEAQTSYELLPPVKARILLVSILIVALCGIVYELIIGTVSSYLLGNSVYQFSLTVGFFMFAMGIGSYLSRFFNSWLIQAFIYVELVLAIVGGICSISLFMTFPYAPWIYQTAMLTFILIIGILVGLEIPLLTRVLADVKGTRDSISDVMSLDYIGALIGSVAFPLFLLPTLGLITSSFAIGLINCLVALINVFWLRDYLKYPKRLAGLVMLTLALLIGLTVYAGRITAFAQQHLYFDRIVWQKQTQYQSLVITSDWVKHDMRLFIDGHLQFSETDEHRYHEALIHPTMSWQGKREKILILGGGDGLAVREILKYDDVETIDLVDIDPDMTKLGKDYEPFRRLNEESLSNPKVTIFNQDAFVFIQHTNKTYDRVIIDFPDPHNEAIAKLYSVEFYQMVRARLNPGAVVVSQSSSPFLTKNTFWSIARTMEEIFGPTTNYNIAIPSFGVWGFNMAFVPDGANRTTISKMPDSLKFMSNSVFQASKIFPVDIERPQKLAVNSIFEPDLYKVYLDDLKEGPLGDPRTGFLGLKP
jgi:spermidine synthase